MVPGHEAQSPWAASGAPALGTHLSPSPAPGPSRELSPLWAPAAYHFVPACLLTVPPLEWPSCEVQDLTRRPQLGLPAGTPGRCFNTRLWNDQTRESVKEKNGSLPALVLQPGKLKGRCGDITGQIHCGWQSQIGVITMEYFMDKWATCMQTELWMTSSLMCHQPWWHRRLEGPQITALHHDYSVPWALG